MIVDVDFELPRAEVLDAMTAATMRSKVALSINLTGGVFVNQSAAYSDYHGTGGNPAANASYSDAAFVANRARLERELSRSQAAANARIARVVLGAN